MAPPLRPQPPRTTASEQLAAGVTDILGIRSTAPPKVSGRPPRADTTALLNPCLGCPRARAPKVKPTIPHHPKLIVVGLAPGEVEEKEGKPFRGPSGEQIRRGLARCGFETDRDVGYMNLARCRPEDDDFESKEWQQAEARCATYLKRDLEAFPKVPLLMLGTRPARRLTGEDVSVTMHRGLWVKTLHDRDGYVARHPSGMLRQRDESLKAALFDEWHGDLKRMSGRVLHEQTPRDIDIKIYRSALAAEPLLRRLAEHQHPWAFDIETYDDKQTPSRKHVSTDPCHEDFRVRGVALAWGPRAGAWVELMGTDPAVAKPLLDPAFMSPAEKWAFNGGFDEEGLTYSDWVSEVTNRRGDGMLEMVALSDGRHASLRLERAVVDHLGLPQYWNGFDKSLIRTLSIEEIARAAVEDACATWALCALLHRRLQNGEYFSWPTWIPPQH